jgi:type I restriction enzyme S subunit
VALGEVIERTDYGTSQKAHQHPDGIPVLRMGNIQDGRIDLSALKFVPVEAEGLPDLLLAPGDLLFNRTNSFELVGKTAVFRETLPCTFASYLIRVRLTASSFILCLISKQCHSAVLVVSRQLRMQWCHPRD